MECNIISNTSTLTNSILCTPTEIRCQFPPHGHVIPYSVLSNNHTVICYTQKADYAKPVSSLLTSKSFLPIKTWLISVRLASLAGYQLTVISGLGDYNLVNIKIGMLEQVVS